MSCDIERAMGFGYMEKDINTLLEGLKEIHSDIKLISTDKIEVAEWVRWKCRYGCKAYGKHLTCPPYTPTPDETRKLINGYEKAVIEEFEKRNCKDQLRARPSMKACGIDVFKTVRKADYEIKGIFVEAREIKNELSVALKEKNPEIITFSCIRL